MWFKLFMWVAIASGYYAWWLTRDTFVLVCNSAIAAWLLFLHYLEYKREQRNRQVARQIAVGQLLEQYEKEGKSAPENTQKG